MTHQNTKYKIILEQIGGTAWVFDVRDTIPQRLGGKGVILTSGRDSDYGCYVTADEALRAADSALNRYRSKITT